MVFSVPLKHTAVVHSTVRGIPLRFLSSCLTYGSPVISVTGSLCVSGSWTVNGMRLNVHSRVGYDQGPQVPHPAAPEYADALASHQRCWEAVWTAQMARGYAETTMTPEFGPDGYLHHLPFTDAPVADLWDINSWIGATEQKHFAAWSHAASKLEAQSA